MLESKIGRHLVELTAPKQKSDDSAKDFEKFQERYEMFLERDYIISITDNPMGNLSYMAPEIIEAFGLRVNPENLLIHLNTFHRKTEEKYAPGKEQNEQDLDILLQHAIALEAKYLLCVTGDGSERLPRLKPDDLGHDPREVQTVTSTQLMAYINKAYPGRFTLGVAFNQYEPEKEELEKLGRKLAAGASFIITQPVVMNEGSDPRISTANKTLRAMMKIAEGAKVQVILGVWMSLKLAYLMPQCVGCDIDFGGFEPYANLRAITEAYPERKYYLGMIFGPQGLQKAEALLGQGVNRQWVDTLCAAQI